MAVLLLATVVAQPVAAQVMVPPALGGSASAFEQFLGAPNDASIGPQLHYLRCAGTDIDQFVVLAPGDQAWTIQREPCQGGDLAPEQRLTEATQFLPPDAVQGESFATEEGEPAVSYVSQTLAGALPAGLFHDCSGQAVPPGTLVVVADASGGWFMGPGTCS